MSKRNQEILQHERVLGHAAKAVLSGKYIAESSKFKKKKLFLFKKKTILKRRTQISNLIFHFKAVEKEEPTNSKASRYKENNKDWTRN